MKLPVSKEKQAKVAIEKERFSATHSAMRDKQGNVVMVRNEDLAAVQAKGFVPADAPVVTSGQIDNAWQPQEPVEPQE